MSRLSTPERIIRFIYNEGDQNENIAIGKRIRTEAKAENLFSQYMNAIGQLEMELKSPSNQSIATILSHC